MIDFRYHLVSLVSVFIALAIGVVLGAGPLRGPLSDTLQSQVSALRTDKENLQKAVNNRDAQITDQDAALKSLATGAVAGRLSNRDITLILLPGADSTGPDGWAELVEASGANLASTVTVTPAWSNPATSDARIKALTDLAPALAQLNLPADANESAKLGALLARAVTAQSTQPRDSLGTDILTGLRNANLVTVAEDDPTRGDLVVVLEPAPDKGAAGNDAQWRKAEVAAGTELVSTLASASSATVLAGPSDSSATLVAAVRGGPLARTVTTVDDVETGLAAPSIVLGLVQHLSGGSGQYGTGANVTAVLPPVPGASPSTSPTP